MSSCRKPRGRHRSLRRRSRRVDGRDRDPALAKTAEQVRTKLKELSKPCSVNRHVVMHFDAKVPSIYRPSADDSGMCST